MGAGHAGLLMVLRHAELDPPWRRHGRRKRTSAHGRMGGKAPLPVPCRRIRERGAHAPSPAHQLLSHLLHLLPLAPTSSPTCSPSCMHAGAIWSPSAYLTCSSLPRAEASCLLLGQCYAHSPITASCVLMRVWAEEKYEIPVPLPVS